MSSHQNSAFHGESAFELAQPPLGRYQAGVRAARPQVRPSPRISHAPDEIWGHYNNYRGNGIVMSAIIHVVLLGVLLSGAFIGHEVVQKVASRQNVILIAPSPESYALPTSKKVISGGGGGGDHDRLPAPKGRLPKTAMQQITPPAIIVRNEKPKLAVAAYRRGSAASSSRRKPHAESRSSRPHAMPAAPPSNGTGSGGGIGSGSGGGVGVGHGPGVGAGSGGGIGGGVYKVGGGISAPQAISSPDPDYTEEARRAKKQGTCVLWLIVDCGRTSARHQGSSRSRPGTRRQSARSCSAMAISACSQRRQTR